MEITDRERALLGRTFLDFLATEDFLECPVILERAQIRHLAKLAERVSELEKTLNNINIKD